MYKKKTVFILLFIFGIGLLVFLLKNKNNEVLLSSKRNKMNKQKTITQKKVPSLHLKTQGSKKDVPQLAEKLTTTERIDYIKKELKNIFPDIRLEILEECPKGFEKSEFWSNKDSGIDSSCRKEYEVLTDRLDFSTEQTYLNGRLILYRNSLEAQEPLAIEFNQAGDLEEISLCLEGASVFIANFRSNLVIDIYISTDEIKRFSKDYESYVERWGEAARKRAHILQNGKIKLLNIISSLCQKFQHGKTCEAYEKLKKLPYPLLDKKI